MPSPPLLICWDGRWGWDNAVLVLRNTAALSLADGAGAIPPVPPHAPAESPEIPNAFCYWHIPLKNLFKVREEDNFEDWVVGSSLVGF